MWRGGVGVGQLGLYLVGPTSKGLLSFVLSVGYLDIWVSARYRLKYCLKLSLNPKQPIINQDFFCVCVCVCVCVCGWGGGGGGGGGGI